jgi:hypothetical protein
LSVVHLLSKLDLKQFFTSKEVQYLAYCSLVSHLASCNGIITLQLYISEWKLEAVTAISIKFWVM